MIALVTTATHAFVLTDDDFEFLNFIVKYNKQYKTVEEFNFRAINFKKTADSIKQINSEQDTHLAAHNYMSDWTFDEY